MRWVASLQLVDAKLNQLQDLNLDGGYELRGAGVQLVASGTPGGGRAV